MHAFGVFDGHGCSAQAAELCKELLMPMATALEGADIAVGLESRKAGNMPRPPSQTDLLQMFEVGASSFTSRSSGAPQAWNSLKDDPKTTVESVRDDRDVEHSPSTKQSRQFSTSDVATSNGTLLKIFELPETSRRTSNVPSDEALLKAFRNVDREMAERYPRLPCGTTATTVWAEYHVAKNVWDLKCGWAGDSRAVLIQDGTSVKPLSIDHHLDYQSERERISVSFASLFDYETMVCSCPGALKKNFRDTNAAETPEDEYST